MNTGQSDLRRYHEYAREQADRFNLRYEVVEGSPAIVKKMIAGPLNSEYVVVPPRQTLEYEAFTKRSNHA